MERDLRDVMAENLGAREQSIGGLAPAPGVLARSVRKVRRRRAVRHTSQAVGGVAIVAVLATGSWFGLRGDHDPVPAVTPTPTPSVSAPAPTPTAEPTVVPDDVLGLPPTLPLPPGLLERTTPGWVLSVYASEAYSADAVENGVDTIPAFVEHTVVLASPTGELYRVLDLPQAMGVRLLHWVAGATTATVSVDWQEDLGQGVVPRAELDLTTGTITPRPVGTTEWGEDASWYFDGVAADGSELWYTPTSTDAATSALYSVSQDGAARPLADLGYTMLLDPTGRRGVTPDVVGPVNGWTSFRVVDVLDGGATAHEFGVPGKTCDVVGWLDPDALLALCLAADYRRWSTEPSGLSEGADWAAADPSMYRIDLSTQQRTLLARLTQANPLPWTWSGTWLRAGQVVYSGSAASLHDPDSCATGAYVWEGGASTLLQDMGVGMDNTFRSTLAGDRLLVQSRPACSGDAQPATVTAYSLLSGASTVLLPAPPVTADVPEWMNGVDSWVVGR